MHLRELRDIVSGGESERVEFKCSTGQRTEAAKAVCAMLNGLGGFVLFGVEDSGVMSGQKVSAKTLEDITAELRRIEPPVFPDIETVNLGTGTFVIAIRWVFDPWGKVPMRSARDNDERQMAPADIGQPSGVRFAHC
jgi:ATP-dependent DNA helicase RecG